MKLRPLGRAALRQYQLPPVIDGDKETKGRILIIAGSRRVPGAALLAATAAMRAGAGKLRIATVSSVATQIGVAMAEAMVVGMTEDKSGGFTLSAANKLGNEAENVDAVVAGPGLAKGPACTKIAAQLLGCKTALVLDAALLHALQPSKQDRSSLPVLLPNAGELASLLDCAETRIKSDPLGSGLDAAQRYRSIMLVKGVTSHIVTPDGRAWVYSGGAAVRRDSESPAAATCSPASSVDCSPAVPSRSTRFSGPSGSMAKPEWPWPGGLGRSAFSRARLPMRCRACYPAESFK